MRKIQRQKFPVGDFILEELKARKWSVPKLMKQSGSVVLNGKQRITASISKDLARVWNFRRAVGESWEGGATMKLWILGNLHEWTLQTWHHSGEFLKRMGVPKGRADELVEPLYRLSLWPELWLIRYLVPEHRHEIRGDGTAQLDSASAWKTSGVEPEACVVESSFGADQRVYLVRPFVVALRRAPVPAFPFIPVDFLILPGITKLLQYRDLNFIRCFCAPGEKRRSGNNGTTGIL
jgi:hypothetical protein